MHPSERNRRVLVIDDNPAIHADVRKILCPPVDPDAEALAQLEAKLLGETRPHAAQAPFQIDSAYQGREGLECVKRALAAGRPYAMAYVDVRMPPGWDGIETTLELWKVAPTLQIVICTAYSDYSWDDMLNRIGGSDRLLILKKPFDTIEVLQLANSLTEKWNLEREARAQAADLEERVRARTAQLQDLNTALHAEISRRVQIEEDLKRAKEAAEKADRAKSAFLANMSHEVRTPMNGVIGMANVLLTSQLDSDQRDYVQTLSKSCDTLLGIINDVLDFSKIEAGGLTLEEVDFDLTENLELALDIQAEAASKKGLELVMDIDSAVPRFVGGDSLRLRQIFLNLMGNAIKFTPKGEVVVRVTIQSETDKQVILKCQISDTGIGIPSEVISELFKPFAQADASTTRKYGGTGLGLAICKRLVEQMGGEIGVMSAPDGGSTFWFTVELTKVAAPPEILTPLDVPIAGRKVLVVDDNETNRKFMSHLLRHWGIDFSGVEAASAALVELRLAAAAGAPYEVALLDYHMPDMDGLGLSAAIRSDPSTGSPLLVLLTSSGERLNAVGMETHGLSACELKPIHPDRLRYALTSVLSRAKKLQASAAPHRQATVEAVPCNTPETVILVAEDNPVNQKVAVLQLRSIGFQADVVGNGKEAIAAIKRRPYGLVLMDAQMPEMDGFEATKIIRKAIAEGDPSFPTEIAIIAMTANAMSSDRAVCIEAGMDDYLAKPVRAEELRAMIERHLKRPGTNPGSAARPFARVS